MRGLIENPVIVAGVYGCFIREKTAISNRESGRLVQEQRNDMHERGTIADPDVCAVPRLDDQETKIALASHDQRCVAANRNAHAIRLASGPDNDPRIAAANPQISAQVVGKIEMVSLSEVGNLQHDEKRFSERGFVSMFALARRQALGTMSGLDPATGRLNSLPRAGRVALRIVRRPAMTRF